MYVYILYTVLEHYKVLETVYILNIYMNVYINNGYTIKITESPGTC